MDEPRTTHELWAAAKNSSDPARRELVMAQLAVNRELQERFNRVMQEQVRYHPLVPPLTRWQHRKRRMASRWSDIRRRVALWIAPELDDY